MDKATLLRWVIPVSAATEMRVRACDATHLRCAAEMLRTVADDGRVRQRHAQAAWCEQLAVSVTAHGAANVSLVPGDGLDRVVELAGRDIASWQQPDAPGSPPPVLVSRAGTVG